MTQEQALDLIALTHDRARHLVRAVRLAGAAVGQVWLQGKNGARMVALFLWQSFRDFGHLQYVSAIIYRNHRPSRALARRVGFQEEGVAQPDAPWLHAALTRDAVAQIDWGRVAQGGGPCPKTPARVEI